MDPKVAQSKKDKLNNMNVRRISNGFMLKTVSGNWFYPDEDSLIKAIRDYLKTMVKAYKEATTEEGV